MATTTPSAARQASTVSNCSRPASWKYQLAVEPFYDSNILRYSDKYIERFDTGEDPGRFRIASIDDTVLRADVRLERHFRGLAGRRARLHLTGSNRTYTENDVKDWSRLEAGWRQSLGSGLGLYLSAEWIPEFYLRHQRDADQRGGGQGSVESGLAGNDHFHAFAFEKTGLDLSLRKRWSSAWSGRLELKASSFDYSEGFSEFDDQQLRLGLRADHRPSDLWRMTCRYRHTRSSARGFDEPGESRIASDDSDTSFEQDALLISVSRTLSLRSRREGRVRLEMEASERRFTTTKSPSLVPLYAGREDARWRIGAFLDFPLKDKLRGTAFAEWQERRARSGTRLVDLSREKDYDLLTFGFRMSFRGGVEPDG